jgi:hypothetical protein
MTQLNSTIYTNNEQQQALQQELISKMSQIDFLVNSCKQLTSTVAAMRNEIGR